MRDTVRRGCGARQAVERRRLEAKYSARALAKARRLIRQMARDNTTWGVPKVHGELLKLGKVVALPRLGGAREVASVDQRCECKVIGMCRS